MLLVPKIKGFSLSSVNSLISYCVEEMLKWLCCGYLW